MRQSTRWLFICSLLASLLTTVAPADEALRLIDNSTGFSQAIDINLRGDVIGLYDVEVPNIGYAQRSFFWSDKGSVPMPPLEGYTNMQATALADNGLVAGYAARAVTDSRGVMEACLWNTADNTIVGLGRLPNHRASQAMDISDDGRTIVGYSTGPDPPTMVPVVWRREQGADGEEGPWVCHRLSTLHEYNPYLLLGRVVVSGDGSQIAAGITVNIIDRAGAPFYQSSTYRWRSGEEGQWQRDKLSDHQLRLGDINDSGMLTGSYLEDRRRRAFVITPRGEFHRLELLAGDEEAEGADVNNAGTVVGYSDDPAGPEGGPTAFIFQDGQLRPLPIPGDPYFSRATAINEAGTVTGYLIPRPPTVDGTEPLPGAVPAVERTVTFILEAR